MIADDVWRAFVEQASSLAPFSDRRNMPPEGFYASNASAPFFASLANCPFSAVLHCFGGALGFALMLGPNWFDSAHQDYTVQMTQKRLPVAKNKDGRPLKADEICPPYNQRRIPWNRAKRSQPPTLAVAAELTDRLRNRARSLGTV